VDMTAGDLTITWIRRTRAKHRVLSSLPTPLVEANEKYEVELYIPADPSTTLRTVTITDATSYVYTAAQQTTDGFTPGDPVGARIFQISQLLGRGPSNSATL